MDSIDIIKKLNNNSFAFYDVNLLNLKNYIGDIILEVAKRGYRVTCIYDEFSYEGMEYFKNIENLELVHVVSNRYNNILRILSDSESCILIHNAQRLSDSAFVAVAKNIGMATIMIQHGMYIPHMKREPSMYLKKIVKTMRYVEYSRVIAKAHNWPFIKTFSQFFKHFAKNIDYRVAILRHREINSDYVFVYGEYWKEYHNSNFGYMPDQMINIGYHELTKIDSISAQPKIESSLTYVAQTLVEDGRMPLSVLENFLHNLNNYAQKANIKVFVKLHPRSNLDYYKNLGFELCQNDVPHTEKYLGHYSSLLALVGNLGKLYLYEFEGHPIPDYFKRCANTITKLDELNDEFNDAATSDLSQVFSNGYSTKKATDLLIKIYENKNENINR